MQDWHSAADVTRSPHVAANHFIQCRVSAETKARLRAAAERQQVTESAVLKRLLDATLGAGEVAEPVTVAAPQRLHAQRLSVRVRGEDFSLLAARAEARKIAPGTYASIALRAHLRGAAPIPKEELETLRRILASLSSLARYFQAIARAMEASGGAPKPIGPRELEMMLKIATAIRDHVVRLLEENRRSWLGAGYGG